MSFLPRRLSSDKIFPGIQFAELKKTALLSTLLPIWQFNYFYAVSRDAAPVYETSFLENLQKSGQKSNLENLQKSGQKSTSLEPFDEFGWLTEKQWALLAPLLPPEPLDKSRGRPAVSSHALINAILWKVAHHASWDDVGGAFPPPRTCRRYYKRWLLSGRLMTIYKVLLQDLLQRGRVHPYDFVLKGYFEITADFRILAIPGQCPDTWQTRLALLLLQETYAILRRLRRQEKDRYLPNRSTLNKLARGYLITRHAFPPHQ
jgi:transposase